MVSNRNIQVQFSGAVDTSVIQAALENPVSPGYQFLFQFEAGDNILTFPGLDGIIVTGVTIIPPAGNTTAMTLKGDPADVGFGLNLVDPSSFGVAEDVTALYITLADDAETITDVIIIFS